MSIQATAWAWNVARLTPGELLVLLVLADMVGDDLMCWPSVALLATRSRCSPGSVRTRLVTLEKRGLIARIQRDGRTAAFRLKVGS